VVPQLEGDKEAALTLELRHYLLETVFLNLL
jgi:hypothetical protein